MYIPPHFVESDMETLYQLIQSHPFADLVTYANHGLDVNHLPFELQKTAGKLGLLRAHVARNNPIWKEVKNGDEVLVVFHAGDAYISPQWYPSKQETHQQVPTWNYQVAHVRGRITIRDEESYVRGVVARLTREHEASQPVPWKMTDSPAEFIDQLLQAIVGIEIEITQIEGKSKLSQNKAVTDISSAADHLEKTGEHAISQAMHQVAALKSLSEK